MIKIMPRVKREREEGREILFQVSITNMSKGTCHLGLGQIPNFTSEEMRPQEINSLFKGSYDFMAPRDHQPILILALLTSDDLGRFRYF